MILCPETLAVVQEIVCHVSDLGVSPARKETVWVRHRVLIIPINNLEIFPEGEDSLWEKIEEIIRWIGIFEILCVLHDFGGKVMGKGRTVEISRRGTETSVGIFVQSV